MPSLSQVASARARRLADRLRGCADAALCARAETVKMLTPDFPGIVRVRA